MSEHHLTIADYLSLARTFAWVANEAMVHIGHQHPEQYAQIKELSDRTHTVIEVLDSTRHKLPNTCSFRREPIRSVGLPPNDSLKKLAMIILSQAGEDGVTIGESSFSLPQEFLDYVKGRTVDHPDGRNPGGGSPEGPADVRTGGDLHQLPEAADGQDPPRGDGGAG